MKTRHRALLIVLASLLLGVATDSQTTYLTMKSAMSSLEYASSGIGSLNMDQQSLIDRWLNRWTAVAIKVSSGTSYTNIEEKQTITENAEGKILILEDGSIWLVEGVDQVDSSLWLETEDVVVIHAEHPIAGFKYTIVNTDDHDKVLAKYLGDE
jgi:hypothetical protein